MRALQKARSKRQREEVNRLWTYTYSPPEYTCIYISSCLYRGYSDNLDIWIFVVIWWRGRFVKLSNMDNRLDYGTAWINRTRENPSTSFLNESNIQLDAPYFSVYVHLTCYKITRYALLIIRCYRYSSHSE